MPTRKRLLTTRPNRGGEYTFRLDGEFDWRSFDPGFVEEVDGERCFHDLTCAGECERCEGSEHVFVGLENKLWRVGVSI